MEYKHIAVVVDFDKESEILVKKGASIARAFGAKLSLIHIDDNYDELYVSVVCLDLRDFRDKVSVHSISRLEYYKTLIDYPVSYTLVSNGDLTKELCLMISEYNIDVVVCGHHHDFWSKTLSSTHHFFNSSLVDTLVVPFQ
ncbi:universal stress protein [Vibrio harveyi]